MIKSDNLQTRDLMKKFLGTAGIQLMGRGLTVITGIILARVLGPEEFGRYGLVMSLLAMATIPTIAGMPQLVIREVAKLQLEQRWCELKGILRWSSLYVIIASAIVMLFISISIYMEWIKPSIGQYLWFGLAMIPMRGLLAKQSAVLSGMRFPVLAQLPQGVIASVVLLIALYFLSYHNYKLDAQITLIIQSGASISAVLVSVYLVDRNIPFKSNEVKRTYQVKTWHSALVPFTLLAVITTLNNELASVLLGFLGTEEAVGYFKVAMQGVTLLSLGLVAINTITGPNIVRLYKKGDVVGVQKLLTQSVRISTLTSVPFALILIFFSDWLVTMLFGTEYLPSAALLSILCVGQIVNVLMGSVGLVLQMTGHEKRALKTLIITLIVTVILLFLLIPAYQAKGAAIAVSISIVLWNSLMAWDVYITTNLKCWFR